jgi:hypothetical protein
MKEKYINNKDYLEIIVSGNITAKIIKEINIETIKKECLKRGHKKILINAEGLTGNLNTIERIDIAKKFENSFLGSNIKIAVLSNEHLEYPNEPVLETAALNRGLNIKVFINLKNAKEWLLK